VERVNSLQKLDEFLEGLKPAAPDMFHVRAKAQVPKNDPLPLQPANLIHLAAECNVKCEVLQLAVIDSFSAYRVSAKEDYAVLAGTRNQASRDR
jgi:hypothetical protein